MSIEAVEVPLGLCGLRIFDLLEFFTLKKSQVSTFTILLLLLCFQKKGKFIVTSFFILIKTKKSSSQLWLKSKFVTFSPPNLNVADR